MKPSIDFVLAVIFIRMQTMNKRLIVLSTLLLLGSWSNADSVNSPAQSQDALEDEDIIGGIGGTGLRDMERPELLERPELELDGFDNGAMSPDFEMDAPTETIDDMETTAP